MEILEKRNRSHRKGLSKHIGGVPGDYVLHFFDDRRCTVERVINDGDYNNIQT